MTASIEVLPSSAQQVIDQVGLQEVAPTVYLPMILGHPLEQQIAAAALLHTHGFTVVPHVAARRFARREQAAALISAHAQNGIDTILLLGGDDRTAGAFDSSLELLESGLLSAYGIKKVCFAGHPEGNPVDPDDLQHMVQKCIAAHERSLAVEIVTQLCFEPDVVNRYTTALKESGVEATLRIGVPGPVKLTALTKFALQCGLGNVQRVLEKQGFSMLRLFQAYDPEKITQKLPEDTVLHVYTFGALQKTQQWLAGR